MNAVRRFPVVFLVVIAAAAEMIALMSGGSLDEWRLLAALSLGLPLSIAFHLFAESLPAKHRVSAWGLGTVVFLALGFYAVNLPPASESAPDYLIHRQVVLFIGLHLLVSFAPFVAGRNTKAFWSFNKTLFLRILTAVLFSGTLYFGLLLILGGLGALFGLGETAFQMVRMYLGVAVFLLFNTWFFLTGLPHPGGETSAAYPKSLRNFCGYILSPLIALSALILLLLAAKGLIQGKPFPGGFSFAPLAVIGILNYLLIRPLDGTVRWVSWYRKFYFAILLPFIALHLHRSFVDPRPEGFKEEDYYYVVLSIWAGAISLYFLISKRREILWVPVSLAVVTFLSVFGPWSAYSVSKRSRPQEQNVSTPETQKKDALGVSFSTSSSEEVVDVKGFSFYHREVHNMGPADGPADCSFELCAKVLEGENKILLFDRKGEKRRVDVTPFLRRLLESKKAGIEKAGVSDTVYLQVAKEDLKFDFPEGRFLFWTVFLEKREDGPRLKAFQANLLLEK